MQDALLLVVSEDWRGPIMGGLFLVLFVAILFFMGKAGKNTPAMRNMPKPFGVYYILAIFMCLFVLAIGFKGALFLLDAFPGSAVFGWAAIGVAVVYLMAFFRSVCLLMTLRPGALQLTRMFLLSLPSFAAAFPFAVFVLCAWWMGGGYAFSVYERHMEPGAIFSSSCLFSIPWLLYFALSSTVKKLAL